MRLRCVNTWASCLSFGLPRPQCWLVGTDSGPGDEHILAPSPGRPLPLPLRGAWSTPGWPAGAHRSDPAPRVAALSGSAARRSGLRRRFAVRAVGATPTLRGSTHVAARRTSADPLRAWARGIVMRPEVERRQWDPAGSRPRGTVQPVSRSFDQFLSPVERRSSAEPVFGPCDL